MKNALQSFKTLKVMLAVPSMGSWHEEFGKSLASLTAFFAVEKVGSYKSQRLHTMSVRGSILPNLRLNALLKARELSADYLLWIDSDQSFPKDTLHRLVMHNKAVVGANIATKTLPAMPTARNKPAPGEPDFGSLVHTDPPSTGLQMVWRLGCGLMLMNRAVIHALPNNCFEMVYKPDVDRYQGEDWTMCEHLERLGFPIFIDHDLSKEVGHHGGFKYTTEHFGEVKLEPLPTFKLKAAK